MKTKPKKKEKRRPINSGDKTTDNLYNSVIDYIEKRGGKVVVIGGTAVVEERSKFNYVFMVRITGQKPDSKYDNKT